MSISQDTGAAATPAAPASEASSNSTDQQISLSLPEPATSEAAKPIELPKIIELPKPVEAVMKAAEELKMADAGKAPVAPLEEPAIVPPVKQVADESRSNRFALLAASVAFAGALGAMAGALGTSVVSRGTAAETPMAAIDLAPVRDSIAGLRAEITAIKSSVEASNRNASAQFAKFTERLERIDRAQAASAQRAQAPGGTVTGSVQPQQVAAAPVAPPTAEAARQRVIDGWTVRHVSRGVAVIQGRRMGAFEVERGDIVPGVGRIEAIQRKDGRWVVVTSNGTITSPTPR